MRKASFNLYSFNASRTTQIYTLSLHDALPIYRDRHRSTRSNGSVLHRGARLQGSCEGPGRRGRSEEHTSELQSRPQLVCRLLLEEKNVKDHVDNSLGLRVYPRHRDKVAQCVGG